MYVYMYAYVHIRAHTIRRLRVCKHTYIYVHKVKPLEDIVVSLVVNQE